MSADDAAAEKSGRCVRRKDVSRWTWWAGLGAAAALAASCSSKHGAPASSPPGTASRPAPVIEQSGARAGGPIDPTPAARTGGGPKGRSVDTGDVAEWSGVVATGAVALGGETSGLTLTTPEAVYELRAAGAARDLLERANGQQVTLRGRLLERVGVELRKRRTIDVQEIVQR